MILKSSFIENNFLKSLISVFALFNSFCANKDSGLFLLSSNEIESLDFKPIQYDQLIKLSLLFTSIGNIF